MQAPATPVCPPLNLPNAPEEIHNIRDDVEDGDPQHFLTSCIEKKRTGANPQLQIYQKSPKK